MNVPVASKLHYCILGRKRFQRAVSFPRLTGPALERNPAVTQQLGSTGLWLNQATSTWSGDWQRPLKLSASVQRGRAQTALGSAWNQTPGSGPPHNATLPPNGWCVSREWRVPHCTDQAMEPAGAVFFLTVRNLDFLQTY